ncbi:MAG: electron transfer flavoprotein subunit beta/FixA family protein [Pseudomonadota bacterium]
MHILVLVKRVVDHNVKVRVKSDGSAVDASGLKMSINPFDEVALEQAVRLKEQGLASRVTAVTCGAPVAQDVLRTALAMGADAAILLDTPQALDPLGAARLFSELARQQGAGLILCGKQAIDDDLGATGPMLAALLDWPQAVAVNRLAIQAGELQVSTDADVGSEQLALTLPAVLSVDLRLCEPRHITLPAMIRAKKVVITTMPAASLASIVQPWVQLLGVAEPAARKPGVRLGGMPALVEHLRRLPAFQPA